MLSPKAVEKLKELWYVHRLLEHFIVFHASTVGNADDHSYAFAAMLSQVNGQGFIRKTPAFMLEYLC